MAKTNVKLPMEIQLPRATRYPRGGNNIGFEESTALPLCSQTGANPKIPAPGKAITASEPATMYWHSTTSGKKS